IAPFFISILLPLPPRSTLFPYTTLFRSFRVDELAAGFRGVGHVFGGALADPFGIAVAPDAVGKNRFVPFVDVVTDRLADQVVGRSEEHTSELQSRENLVCRLLLEKKNND